MESQPQNTEFRNNPEKLTHMSHIVRLYTLGVMYQNKQKNQFALGLQINKNFGHNCSYFLIHQFLNIYFCVQKNRLIETVLLSTHNICFGSDIRTIIVIYNNCIYSCELKCL